MNTTLPVMSSNTPVDDEKNQIIQQLSLNKQIDLIWCRLSNSLL